MARNLVIVESPAKAKAIGRYLGDSYAVKASVGHVRDLPEKGLGVDIENGFVPQYVTIEGKQKVIDELCRAVKTSQAVILATDPDREGEAIAWHVSQVTNCDPSKTQRVSFHQITPDAVREAVANPRQIDMNLVDAQQARRVLDRLVGYQISPLLNKAAKDYGQHTLSAGRVQSVALRLVVERERAIMAFVPVEFWTLDALLHRQGVPTGTFQARLVKVRGQDPELHSQHDVDLVQRDLEQAVFSVLDVAQGNRRQSPPPPFITSSLQAEASRKLRFSPRQTMRLAQQLYEGVELSGETIGLITYMRTDSTQVASEAQQQARQYISTRWGEKYLPPKPPFYRSKVANAQEAHEAIRPTSALRSPEAVAAYLDKNQLALYELIWRRFLASQMKPALYATTTINIQAGADYLFRAIGSTLLFPGYRVVYTEASEEGEEEGDVQLPELTAGEVLICKALLPEQHFTEPPARYSESSLIKELEKNGIGRPSTYATIIGVIEDRGYVNKEKGRLHPTDIGFIVCDTLVRAFSDIMSVRYTAGMEEQLDQVSNGTMRYFEMLAGFYNPFAKALRAAQDIIPGALEQSLWEGLSAEMRSAACPSCGKPLRIRLSGNGRFLACTGYPVCRYTRDLASLSGKPPAETTFAEGEQCELCGGRMKLLNKGRYKFLGCENYPTCRNTRALLSATIKQVALEQACPQCGTKPLQPRKGRFGEYLSCPSCKVNYSLAKLGLKRSRASRREAAPAELVAMVCPDCSQATMERRVGKFGLYYRCPDCKKNYSAKKLGLSSDTIAETA